MKNPLLLIVALAVIVFGWHYFTAHTVDPDVLERVEAGMTWEEVKVLVGTEQDPVAVGSGEFMVALRRNGRWCMVDVFVDEDGKVTSVFHDH